MDANIWEQNLLTQYQKICWTYTKKTCQEGVIVLEGHLEDLQMKVSRLQNRPKPLEMKAPKHLQVSPQELQNQPHEKELHKK